MRRFYGAVSAEDGAIRLDGQPVRTPARAVLRLPTAALAEAVAEEWRAQGERIEPRSMPLTGLANAALDRIAPDPAGFAAGLARYGESDLLCYRAKEPAPLVARQGEAWDPLIGWAASRYDVGFAVTAGIVHKAQPAATVARLAAAVAALDPFRLAGLSPLVTVGGSLVTALAVLEAAVAPDAAWKAVNLDEDWQAEHWGEDPLAAQARAARQADWAAAARFLALLT
jgi:chaperone required for assembly of F1-ATPase